MAEQALWSVGGFVPWPVPDRPAQFDKFDRIIGMHQAATKMREWLDRQGLILPADL
jgi:hypothetical protein